jgi:hypothetical protein
MSTSPSRPPNMNDELMGINGSPQYLGALVSTGTAVNNATTATPFNATALNPPGFTNTLAGKVLLLQTSAAGLIKRSNSATMVAPTVVVAQQSVMPPAANTEPGVSLASGERVVVTMLPTDGWLQWLPVTGSANLLVWELV